MEQEGLEELKSANTWGVWEKVESKTTNAVSDNAETEENESKEATTFTFSRIDDGFYKLVETKVPEGYNAIDPVIFKIHADHVTTLVGETIWGDSGLTVKIEGSDATDSATRDEDGEIVGITMDVTNNAGAELPSTGGMGTTMLYIVGGLMVMFAVVMLVTKKRMSVDA